MVDVPKLEDAELAGTADSSSCTLIVCEGDSAKALAVAGLEVVGRQTYGVYPLKGKPLNVREVSATKVASNGELTGLMKALGLQPGMHVCTHVCTARKPRAFIIHHAYTHIPTGKAYDAHHTSCVYTHTHR